MPQVQHLATAETSLWCGRWSPGDQGVASGSGAATYVGGARRSKACADVSERTRGQQGRQTPTSPPSPPPQPIRQPGASWILNALNFPAPPRPPREPPAPSGIPCAASPAPLSAHLHAEVRQPRLQFRLQGQNERAGS